MKMLKLESDIKRNNGVAIWRQIADEIRGEITTGKLPTNARMPSEMEMAARFGVNRHTVRNAIASLVQEGVLRAEQGRGTFVANAKRLTYAIGRRTRFSQALATQTNEMRGMLLGSGSEAASYEVANALKIRPGEPVIRLESLHMADGHPVSRATLWFDAGRFPTIAEEYDRTASITKALAKLGIADYLRQSSFISARHADSDDLKHLQLSPGAIVLTVRATNIDLDGTPIQYSRSRFSADRMELSIEMDAMG